MARETVMLENAGRAAGGGPAATGEAVDVARYSDVARIAIGTLWIVGGVLGGLMFIIVPVVHLITTWALPLGGILLGLRAYKRRLVVYQVTATCPACHEPIDLVGGSVDDPAWQTCPKCKTPLKVRPTGRVSA
jgi:hypothetical protein